MALYLDITQNLFANRVSAGLLLLITMVVLLLSVKSAFADGPPEVAGFLVPVPHQTSLFVEGGIVIANGLATEWHFEFASSEAMFAKEEGILIPNCSGTITQAEAEASEHQIVLCKEKISGLSPETTYYFRLVVENVENPAEKGSLSEPATTSTRHPIIESPPETSHSAAFSV